MHSEDESLSHVLAQEDWKSLALMLISMDVRLGDDRLETRKLQKELCMTKAVLYNYLSVANGSNTIDLSFFVGAVKLVRRLEKEYDRLGIQRRDFVIFLNLLLTKFSQQKLMVAKPAERKAEFKKHKQVVEDEYIPV
ncbi:MAG: hypothetical protein ABII71_03700 [Candidatus Micrarchaeota archaeon]